MIYTRFGTEVKVIANHGTYQLKAFKHPIEIVSVRDNDSNIFYQFSHTLKADGGWVEILIASEIVPRDLLKLKDLRKAIEQAL